MKQIEYIHTSLLKQCELYLNKYFGISYDYFENEIMRLESYFTLKPKVGESSTLMFFETDEMIPFYHSIIENKFHQLFEIIKEDDDNDEYLIWTLWFVAYVVMEDNNKWRDELVDYAYLEYDIIREDLLRLYIFKETCNPQTPEGQKLILKHSTGNISIGNYENWFTKILINEYLNEYLADIKSVEQAEQELKKYKGSVGRKINDPRLLIIMFGIYRMFNENKKMKSPKSDSLCDFILSYLHFVGILKNEADLERAWIRAQIKYIEGKNSPPLFPHIGVSKRVSLDDLKNSGVRLY